jgi:hypothetical protein
MPSVGVPHVELVRKLARDVCDHFSSDNSNHTSVHLSDNRILVVSYFLTQINRFTLFLTLRVPTL